jgi:hypothetical protein
MTHCSQKGNYGGCVWQGLWMGESAQPSSFPLCCMFTVQLVRLPFCLFLRVIYVVVMSLCSFKITNAPPPLSAPSTNDALYTPAPIRVPEMPTFVIPNYNNSPDPINAPPSPPKPLLGSFDHDHTNSYHLSWPLSRKLFFRQIIV